MLVYLLGIFMGAIDTGIVTPARNVIQNFLAVDDKTGIWMITMYTLAYAASIPVMGKLADKYGRKIIYIISISLFGIGSLFCGLSQNFDSFTVLLIARAVQAIGGGGIVPVATAEFGTTFPKEKRGMALGLVGGVYGIANIFGSSAGSAILDIFGNNNWQYIFYINVPITLFIIIAGLIALPNSKAESVKKIDIFGISILTLMILSVLYGLKKIDFFDFSASITNPSVYPFLLIFLVLLPVFIFAEKRAEDPVMNLEYFKNVRIIITLILSFMTGVILMGMIFVPQFSENTMKIPTGSGGYFVLILGVFAGVGAPISGKLIDKLGVKIVLGFGFFVSALGSVFLVLVTANYPNMITVFISLMLVGLGIGFTMGTPLNYMMMENTKEEEANSALATVSLIRSIGTAIAPAIMIGFISHAGMSVQSNIMALLPSEVSLPELPYAQELTEKLDTLKSDPDMKDKLAGVDIPDLSSMQTVKINMNDTNSNIALPPEILTMLQSSDVTTITEACKVLSNTMFDKMTPDVIDKIESGLDSGIASMQDTATGMEEGITGMQAGVQAQQQALTQLESLKVMMARQMTQAASTGGIPQDMPSSMTTQAAAPMSIVDMIPEEVRSRIPQNVLTELSDIKTLEDLDKKIEELKFAIQDLSVQADELTIAKAGITDTINKMAELKNAIPGAFDTAKNNYLSEIEQRKVPIESKFQETLNVGFKQVYLTVTIASILSFLILLIYKKNKAAAINNN
jgi:EmrB/QacA subfamily drug resistance transporter